MRPRSSSDVIKIDRDEAVKLQWKLIYDWRPKRDVWPYREGLAALASITAISSLVITNHYRRKLKLHHFGRIGMYIPCIAVPTFLIPLLHSKLVSEEILLQSSCPVCIQMRSVAVQSIIGIAYPVALSSASAFAYGNMYGTYSLPLLERRNIPELYSLWKKFSQRLTNRLTWLWAAHVILAVAITNFEASSLFNIQKALLVKINSKEQLDS